MPKLLLTPATVADASCPPGKRKVDLFDSQSKGLVLEVRESGGKTYYLRYQDYRGRTRQLRLADARDVSLSQARGLADKARNKNVMGVDPYEQKNNAKLVPTFAKFIDDQYLPFVKGYKRSWETDWSLLRCHLLPRFGTRYLDEIVRQDIVKMHHDRLSEGAAPGSANRLLIMMRYIFNLAVRWEVPGIKVNPTKGVPLYEENNKKERYLSKEEAQSLYVAVQASDNKLLQFIIPMLILTGARKREVLDAQWVDFNLEKKVWRIPISKSGKARHVPLSDGVLQLLSSLHDFLLAMSPSLENCPWAFPNPKTGKAYVSIFYSWNTARKQAGLADVRIHDLRHSFASFLINNGRTLYEVQHILGHTQVKTTQRYAHLSQDTLLIAANTAMTALGNAFMPALHKTALKPLLEMAHG